MCIRDRAMEAYHEEVNHKVMTTAADVEYEGYCHWTRIQEIVEFAKRMGYHKLGIATCVGLLHEARIAAKILRSHGFEVYLSLIHISTTCRWPTDRSICL